MSLDALVAGNDVSIHPRWVNGIYRVDVRRDVERSPIASIENTMALRMYALFDACHTKNIARGSFNCVAAVHYVTGKSSSIFERHGMQKQGEPSYVEDALRHMQTPFVFQICQHGYGSPKVDHLQHTGLVLGAPRNGLGSGEPVIFEKDCYEGALQIVPWSNVWKKYFQTPEDSKNRYVTCLEVENLQ